MKRWLIAVVSIAVLVVLALGCILVGAINPAVVSRLPLLGPGDPLKYARESAYCDPVGNVRRSAKNIRVEDKINIPRGGLLVFFSGDCPPSNRIKGPHRLYGFHVVERRRLAWVGPDGTDVPTPAADPAREFVEYASNGIIVPKSRHAFVYGHALVSEVSAVEALFDNGAIRRNVPRDGRFVLAAQGATAACEIRVLGRGGELLRSIDLGAASCKS